MEYKDYYKVLGVDKKSSQDEIKRAYKKLARKYHPDVSKEDNAEDKFKEVGEAYEVLKDPEKRTAYDLLGASRKPGQEDFQPPPGWDSGFEFHGGGHNDEANDAAGFSDFFESLFGRQGGGFQSSPGGRQTNYQSSGDARGQDSHAKVAINVEDAYHGISRSLILQTTVMSNDGHPHLKERTLNIKIPKGVKEGQNIRLQGQGSPGFGGGTAGDLYLEIEFTPHSRYKVSGLDVALELPITPWEAALGGKVVVPTPAGKIDLTIPKCTSSGKRMRLKGRGIPGKKAGDFYITLEIVLPDNLSDEETTLYQALQKASNNFNPRVKKGE